MPHPREQQHALQTRYLETLAAQQIANVDMSSAEYQEKDSFRGHLEHICHEVCSAHSDRLPRISLEPFGSFQSGFATAGSDMDLVIAVQDRSATSAVFSLLEDDLPRVLEKRLLELGIGARLLTRTRVPIIKVCEKPGEDFLQKLREEREKWDALPEQEKYPHLYPTPPSENGTGDLEQDQSMTSNSNQQHQQSGGSSNSPFPSPGLLDANTPVTPDFPNAINGLANGQQDQVHEAHTNGQTSDQTKQRREEKPWTRERKAGPLDFPKHGVGVQSDINFFNPLGLHNTQLLRCYSLCDARVRPIVLFVKAWAKCRRINSSYSGTLSSYGYVLMVLHYLTNIANPPVLPNLQSNWTPFGAMLPAGEAVDGWDVRFWRNEQEIRSAAQHCQLTQNHESIGSLLAGFFHYYSSQGGGVTFRWMQEVLSLRSQGGLLTKEEKGWVRAVTEEGEGKKIQHRYLFCIEDPFELTHNVARTVTHKGIVAIRDEFRRAHRILVSIGMGNTPREGELFSELVEAEDFIKATEELKANGAAGVNGSANGFAVHNGHQQGMNQARNNSQQAFAANQRVIKQPGRGRGQHNARAFNVDDNDAFPSLGKPLASPGKKKESQTNFSEISGDKARAYLEEVKRKKDEAQAESTATLAAESVLDGW
jgi:terminal uridylyltransferase